MTLNQRKPAGIDQPARQPQRLAILSLRAIGKGDRAEVVGLAQSSVASNQLPSSRRFSIRSTRSFKASIP